MKYGIYLIFSYFFLFPIKHSLYAQAGSCYYTLELYDNTGDGWNNGARIAVINGGLTQYYTLDNFNDDGLFKAIQLFVKDGDSLALEYYSGGLQDLDNGYRLLDSDGMLLFSDGPFPRQGRVFQNIAKCPSCRLPEISSIRLGPVRSSTVSLNWNPSLTYGTYLIRLKNETLGLGQITEYKTTATEFQIQGLQELTTYSFTVAVICGSGDTSATTIPYSFTTRRANDVGVSAITAPVSSCELGSSEKIEITLKNYGGLPQDLFEYKFGVNGEEANINVPFDGFYTGVLGMDSTYTIEFDQRHNFGEEGLYIIKAWTELENDSQQENDTFTYRLVHIPEIAQYPYFTDLEEWESGWTTSTKNGVNSWEYGLPQGILINGAASGKNIWATNLNGSYNHKEESYIYSPCLDFSSLTVDPIFSFSLFLDTETGYDLLWLEGSIDGGKTWNKVGSNAGGVNWYNNAEKQVWSGQGVFKGWVYAAHPMQGYAGKKDVRLRFVFTSDVFISGEGIGLDNFSIHAPFTRDAASLNLGNLAEGTCGSAADRVRFTFINMGTVRITSLSVGYQIQGENQVIENLTSLNINPGQRYTHTFSREFNSKRSGEINLKAWVSLVGEENRKNDTLNFVFPASREIPFIEDFEEKDFLAGWKISEGFRITPFHQNTSRVLAFNLYRDEPVYQVELPQIGPVSSKDSLTFDYRWTTYESGGLDPHNPGQNDVIRILISEDCGASYSTLFEIDKNNHIRQSGMRTIRISLGAYSGKTVLIKFEAVWGEGDYWVDLDHIGVFGCPSDLGLTFDVIGVSGSGAQDGKIVLNATQGTPPFQYFWNNGSYSKNLVQLAAGVYEVKVKDFFGCEDIGQVNLGLASNIREVEALRNFIITPNPSSGNVFIEIEFEKEMFTEMIIISSFGQMVARYPAEQIKQKKFDLNLGHLESGIYHISLRTFEGVVTKRLVLLRN